MALVIGLIISTLSVGVLGVLAVLVLLIGGREWRQRRSQNLTETETLVCHMIMIVCPSHNGQFSFPG